MRFLHPEDEYQAWALESYCGLHPGATLRVSFNDGEVYLCTFDTAYDTDNAGDLGIDSGNPLFDEFHQVSMRATCVLNGGLRLYGEWLNLDYRDWPCEIRDEVTGEVLASQAGWRA